LKPLKLPGCGEVDKTELRSCYSAMQRHSASSRSLGNRPALLRFASARLMQPGPQTTHAFHGGDARRIAKIAMRARDVEIVRRPELRRREPSHARLARES